MQRNEFETMVKELLLDLPYVRNYLAEAGK